MTPRRLLLLSMLVLSALQLPAAADVTDKLKCSDATYVFSQATGCVKRRKADKASPEAQYQAALDTLAKDPKQAFALFGDACKRNHAAACQNVASIYQSGRGRVVTKDPKQAMKFYERACELGDGRSCQRRGNDLMSTDAKVARGWLDKGCTKNDGTACAQLAFLMENGMGGAEDKTAAKTYFDKAHKLLGACKGNGEACFVRGYLAEKGIGEKADEAKAADAYKQACGESYGDGCAFYARSLDRTGGSEQLAIEFYEKACQYERADACSTAAGRLADADHAATKPLELATRACELDTQQCFTLARLYELGRGGLGKPDNVKATATFKSACDAGDQDSCVSFAKRIRDGLGATADKALAGSLMEKACTAEEAGACEQLAVWLLGDKTDDAHAYDLATRGCTLGSRHACYVAGWAIRANRRGGKALAKEDAAKEALPLFDKACDAGSASGCESSGDVYRAGLGVPKDLAKAFKNLSASCFSEVDPQGSACLEVAEMAKAGEGTTDNADKVALRAGARACAYGESAACMPLMSVKVADEVATVVAELSGKCRTGDETACQWEANARTLGTTDDKKRALELFTESCKRKVAFACVRQGDLINTGVGTKADSARAEQIWSELCDDGSGDGCMRLVLATYLRKDLEASLKWSDKACTVGAADGCSQAGFYYMTAQKPIPWDVKKGATYYAKACELGSALGCSNEGALFRFGIDRPVDATKAYERYAKSCDGGSQHGCEGAAYYLSRGEGGAKKDAARAIALLRAACENDEPSVHGCVELGNLLEAEKQGTPSEIARVRLKGFTLAEKEAETNPSYMYWLGTYYRDGVATVKDPTKALSWFEKSCEGFWPLGCVEAGKTLSASTDPAARERGLRYYERACAAGVDDGCKGFTANSGRPAAAAGPTPTHKPHTGCSVASGSGELGLALVVGVVAVSARRRRRRSAAA